MLHDLIEKVIIVIITVKMPEIPMFQEFNDNLK